ncbi:MAG: alkaline phosphatase [Pseudohongiellaceae bacterium]|jgi:alkaline phosphatase
MCVSFFNRLSVSITLCFCLGVNAKPGVDWHQQGQQALKQALSVQPNTKRAKNIILFVGDGMGVATVTAARIYEGQQLGLAGEEHQLFFEKLPYTALSKTYNTNQQTGDSAGTMSAMMTGVKTKAGFISIDESPQRGECKKSLSHSVPSFLEQAEQAGLATGVVSTTRITHATPAATYAHSPERNWENDSDLSAEAKQQGCKDMAAQLLAFNKGNGIDVLLGGGRRNFLPLATVGEKATAESGRRSDGRNLITEWQDKYPNGHYVSNKQQFEKIDVSQTQQLLGLFNSSHMAYAIKNKNDEPSLADMTAKAIEVLSKNQQGFFLMVEGGRIDHGHHANHAKIALTETVEFAAAIKKATSLVSTEETLIIVTADHSHVMTLGGYATRGNPILGKVVANDDFGNAEIAPELAADGKPHTVLLYANGQSAIINQKSVPNEKPKLAQPRQDLAGVDTESDQFHQPSLVPLSYGESHGGEDVAIYATGPWAHLVKGVQEQNYIYHVMHHAAQLDSR